MVNGLNRRGGTTAGRRRETLGDDDDKAEATWFKQEGSGTRKRRKAVQAPSPHAYIDGRGTGDLSMTGNR